LDRYGIIQSRSRKKI